MYYTQSTVCQRGFCEHIFSNKFRSSSPWAYARFAKGKTQPFGVAGRIACREAVCDLWRNQAFIGGGGGCWRASGRKFFRWCNLLRLGGYFHKFFYLSKNLKI